MVNVLLNLPALEFLFLLFDLEPYEYAGLDPSYMLNSQKTCPIGGLNSSMNESITFNPLT